MDNRQQLIERLREEGNDPNLHGAERSLVFLEAAGLLERDAAVLEDQSLRNQDYASAVEELRLLRDAAATCWRYVNGELVDGVRQGRHTPEVAANIAEQQAANLLKAIKRTGELAPDGTAGGQFHIPTPHRAALQHAQEQVGND
jgi:hypothetical protein